MALRLACLLALAGCLADPTVECGELRCPSGMTCTPGGCATPDNATACAGLAEGVGCTSSTIAAGACHGGACRPIVCGDNLIDLTEACDDGNATAGDGCSASCESDETCGNGVVDAIAGEQCDTGVPGLSSDGCSSRCQGEVRIWRDVTPRPMDGRAGHMMAYDPDRKRVVLFGGYTISSSLAETWELDNNRWRPRAPPVAPPARANSVMAFDPVSRRVVMFGGTAGGLFADMWSWDGQTWTELHPAHAPSARWGMAIALDPSRNRLVLFGGADASGVLGDTWEWDGTDWIERAPAMSPSPRHLHAMTYDPLAQRIVLYGGSTGGGDTWSYDGTTWAPRPTTTKPIAVHSMEIAYHANRGTIMLFGGDGPQGRSGELWELGTDWERRLIFDGPGARADFAMTYDSFHGGVVLTGGIAGGNSPPAPIWDDTWTFESSWRVPSQQAVSPPDRTEHGLAYDARRGKVVVYGGRRGGDEAADLWEWDGLTWEQPSYQGGPQGRYGAAVAYHETQGVTLVFGGVRDGNALADTWLWHGTGWTQRTSSPSPSARAHAAAAYDTARSRVVVFGGATATAALADTWEWTGTAWSASAPATSPPGRLRAAIAYDRARGRTVLFGGIDGTGTDLGDTWEYDGTTWTPIETPMAPLARHDALATYDPGRRRIVLHGGATQQGTSLDDTWEYDGTWQRVVLGGSTNARSASGLVYDAIHRRCVMFGGTAHAALTGDTWALESTLATEPTERCAVADVDEDGDGRVTCDDPDCWGRCTPLCPPGEPCATTAPSCGDGMCWPTEDDFVCPADCL